ncbi:SLC24A2, partial [Symbiodinium necroappetens]
MAVGLDAKDVEALEKVGVNSLAKVAFMTSYTPGSGDDKDLIAAFESALGSPPSVGQKSSFRKLRSETKVEVRADTSTELLLQLALQRRGIAMEMANILDYHVHYHWVERLLSARLDSHPATHLQPTLDQCQQADRKLWQLLGESTRSGIQLKAGGRPLDGIFEKTWQSPEVLHLLQPMPRAAGSSASNQVTPPPKFHGAGPYERPNKGTRKGTGKGNKGGKGGGKVPSALSGCRSCTNAGENICFGYGLKTCRETVTRGEPSSSQSSTQSRASPDSPGPPFAAQQDLPAEN